MNAAEEARHKFSSAPTDLRFAVLFSPRAQRAALTALLAMYLEIREILHECSDADVARAKLTWWQEEVGLLSEQQPRHPLAINLVQYLPKPFASKELLLEIIEGFETDISSPAFRCFKEVERYCQQRGGALLQLTAVFAGAQQAATMAAARNLGTAWQLADIVVQTGEHARHGRSYFAAEDLRKHGLDRHIVVKTHTDAGLKALLSDYAQRAQTLEDSALSQPSVEPQRLVAARVLNGLARARLKKFATRGYDTMQPPVELRPLARLLIAWFCARHVSH